MKMHENEESDNGNDDIKNDDREHDFMVIAGAGVNGIHDDDRMMTMNWWKKMSRIKEDHDFICGPKGSVTDGCGCKYGCGFNT